MKPFTFLATALLALVVAGAVSAESILVRMSPQGLKATGFHVTTQKLESGRIEFKISRELSKSQKPGRSASLEVGDERGVIVRCQVDGERSTKSVVYRFELMPEFERGSVFTLCEDLTDPAKPGSEKILGGADYYQFHLADFSAE